MRCVDVRAVEFRVQHHPWGMMRIRSSAIGGRLEDPGFLTGRAPKRLRSPAVELILSPTAQICPCPPTARPFPALPARLLTLAH